MMPGPPRQPPPRLPPPRPDSAGPRPPFPRPPMPPSDGSSVARGPPPRPPLVSSDGNNQSGTPHPTSPIPNTINARPPPRPPLLSADGNSQQLPRPPPARPILDSNVLPRPPRALPPPPSPPSDGIITPSSLLARGPPPRPPINYESGPPRPPRGLPPPPIPPTDGNITPSNILPRGPPPRPTIEATSPPRPLPRGLPPPPIPPTDGNISPSTIALRQPARPPSSNDAILPKPISEGDNFKIVPPKTQAAHDNTPSGFNSAMLDKARLSALQQKKGSNGVTVENESEEGWSDDDFSPPQSQITTTINSQNPTNINSPNISPTNSNTLSNLKTPISRPPAVTKPPPVITKKTDILSNSNESPVSKDHKGNSAFKSSMLVSDDNDGSRNSSPAHLRRTSQLLNNNSQSALSDNTSNFNSMSRASPTKRQKSPSSATASAVLNRQSQPVTAMNKRDKSPGVKLSNMFAITSQDNSGIGVVPLSSSIKQAPISSINANNENLNSQNAQKISLLENELTELKMKHEALTVQYLDSQQELELAREELSKPRNDREVTLERELNSMYNQLEILKRDNKKLELSIQELHNQLTMSELASTEFSSSTRSRSNNANGASTSNTLSNLDINQVNDVIKSNEREKLLEQMLIKAKDEKAKAVRLILQIVGTEKVNELMLNHAGSSDVLDVLQKSFNSSINVGIVGSSPNTKNNSVKTKGSKLSHTKNMATRSRIDEYFKNTCGQFMD